MTFNSNISIAIIAEDMVEIVICDKDEGIKNSELNWHLADHLLKNQNDIEAIASEEMISIRSKVIPIDTQKIEIGISTFDFSSMKKIDHQLEIPICYENTFGIDLDYISKQLNLSTKEIIEVHSSTNYEVKAIGFTPGFAYLGDLDKRLFVPRLSKPRLNTPVGSVAIANDRTGVYSLGGPGGWPIIGATP
jgi:Allophanate hydrolase subunit 1